MIYLLGTMIFLSISACIFSIYIAFKTLNDCKEFMQNEKILHKKFMLLLDETLKPKNTNSGIARLDEAFKSVKSEIQSWNEADELMKSGEKPND
jgi:hypothetical protein